MNIPPLSKIAVWGMAGILVVFVVVTTVKQKSYQKKINDLQNSLASSSKTIEVADGLFKKAALDVKDLKNVLDQQDKQIVELEKQVKNSKQELVHVTGVSLKIKDSSGKGDSKQTSVPATPTTKARERVDFKKEFDFLRVEGYTLTDPPESWVKLTQTKPLKLLLSMARNKDGTFQTYVSSDYVDVAIDMTAINKSLFDLRWYEKICLNMNFGGGSSEVVSGLSVMYDAGKFSFGPGMWISVDDQVRRYYGFSFSWRPFLKR